MLPAQLSRPVSVPVREPSADAENVTPREHEAPCARTAGQLLIRLKSPVALIPVMESGASAVFVSVMVCAGPSAAQRSGGC